MDIISQFALVMIIGVVSGIIAVRLKLPLIVGYIFGGALFVIFAGNDFDHETAEGLGELGIALLLFTIGLEFSLEKLLEVKKYAVIGGIAQIIATIIFAKLVFPLFGFGDYESLFLGCVFSLSSTAVVLKVLESIGQIETQASRISMGWLILQDIAVIVLIVLLESFATEGADTGALFESLLKAFVLIGFALVLGRRIIPNALTMLAKVGTKELLMLCALGFALLFALLAESFAIPLTLGAFLAGIMLSESILQHEIFSEIKPLQNLFSIFFFVLIGTFFSLDFLLNNFFLVLVLLALTIFAKFVIVIVITQLSKMHIRNSIEVALNLAQIGEFAFLSSQVGLSKSWIDEDLYNIVISVTILSLIIAPLLIAKSDAIYELIRNFSKERWQYLYRKMMRSADDVSTDTQMSSHIIVCGFGRVGKYLALALRRLKMKVIVIEFDLRLAEDSRKHGIETIYGDATSEEILLQAGIKTARAMLVALPKESDVVSIASQAAKLNPNIKIIIRRHSNHEELTNVHKLVIVEPEFEAALRIIENMLKLLGKRDKKVLAWLRDQQHLLGN